MEAQEEDGSYAGPNRSNQNLCGGLGKIAALFVSFGTRRGINSGSSRSPWFRLWLRLRARSPTWVVDGLVVVVVLWSGRGERPELLFFLWCALTNPLRPATDSTLNNVGRSDTGPDESSKMFRFKQLSSDKKSSLRAASDEMTIEDGRRIATIGRSMTVSSVSYGRLSRILIRILCLLQCVGERQSEKSSDETKRSLCLQIWSRLLLCRSHAVTRSHLTNTNALRGRS